MGGEHFFAVRMGGKAVSEGFSLAEVLVGVGGVPREQKMLEGHLLRVIYHQVYQYTKKKCQVFSFSLDSGPLSRARTQGS